MQTHLVDVRTRRYGMLPTTHVLHVPFHYDGVEFVVAATRTSIVHIERAKLVWKHWLRHEYRANTSAVRCTSRQSWSLPVSIFPYMSSCQFRKWNRKFSSTIYSMEKFHNEARLTLMQSLEGPQDIELEMSMTVFKDGQPSGTNVAKLFLFVSEYQY